MQETSQYVYGGANPTAAPQMQTTGGKTIGKIRKTAFDLSNILQAVDRALNPGKYAGPAYQPPAQQKTEASFPWGTALAASAMAGGLLFAGMQVVGDDVKQAKRQKASGKPSKGKSSKTKKS